MRGIMKKLLAAAIIAMLALTLFCGALADDLTDEDIEALATSLVRVVGSAVNSEGQDVIREVGGIAVGRNGSTVAILADSWVVGGDADKEVYLKVAGVGEVEAVVAYINEDIAILTCLDQNIKAMEIVTLSTKDELEQGVSSGTISGQLTMLGLDVTDSGVGSGQGIACTYAGITNFDDGTSYITVESDEFDEMLEMGVLYGAVLVADTGVVGCVNYYFEDDVQCHASYMDEVISVLDANGFGYWTTSGAVGNVAPPSGGGASPSGSGSGANPASPGSTIAPSSQVPDSSSQVPDSSTQAPDASLNAPEKEGLSVSSILLIVVGVLVVAGVVVLLVFLSKKKGQANPYGGPGSFNQTTADMPKTSPLPFNVGATVAQPVTPTAAANEYKAELVCVAGPLSGQTFRVEGSAIIGRDPARCGVCLPNETGGVSGTHLEVKAVADGVIVTDLGSTYGTYMANGVKLTPNQPYPAPRGDAFYLGSKQVGFSIQ